MSDYVMVPVPEELVPRVYELLADLERGRDSTSPSPVEAGAGPILDEGLARRMFRESEDRHRRLLKHLAANAGRWIPMSELMEALGAGRAEMAGVFGAFGRRSKHRYGGATPWLRDWRSEDDENVYRMSPVVARWIQAEAADLEPDAS
jgi:hypothetical protein